jgi:ATP/ADP translocase
MKIMEYSFRGVANEMVYASLDFESRYVGKEIIGLGCRFGKSGMAITLFLLASWYEDASLLVHHSMIALTVVSIIWLGVSFQLNNLIKASKSVTDVLDLGARFLDTAQDDYIFCTNHDYSPT